MYARYEIELENYCKTINIEALTMADMARHDIFPAVSAYGAELAANATAKSAFVSCNAEIELLRRLTELTDIFYEQIKTLEHAVSGAEKINMGKTALAMYYKDKVVTAMAELRKTSDALEELTASSFWPYPSYGDMLFSIK